MANPDVHIAIQMDPLIGDALRISREEAGMRQSDLAEATGLSARRIGDIERGIGTPSLLDLAAIIQVLGRGRIEWALDWRRGDPHGTLVGRVRV